MQSVEIEYATAPLYDEFFCVYGRAMFAWQEVETALSMSTRCATGRRAMPFESTPQAGFRQSTHAFGRSHPSVAWSAPIGRGMLFTPVQA